MAAMLSPNALQTCIPALQNWESSGAVQMALLHRSLFKSFVDLLDEFQNSCSLQLF
jgi:hypothetical protein